MESSEDFIQKMMELGIGMSMIQQMPGIMNNMMPAQFRTPAGQAAAPTTPPPVSNVPKTVFYLAVEGAQAGPFSEEEMLKLIKGGVLQPDTLVWKTGMAQWAKASSVPEINKLMILAKADNR